jgi:hypothetical protein
VSASEEVQRQRVLARPGMTAEKLDAIRARQVCAPTPHCGMTQPALPLKHTQEGKLDFLTWTTPGGNIGDFSLHLDQPVGDSQRHLALVDTWTPALSKSDHLRPFDVPGARC